MAGENSGRKDEEITGRESSEYVQAMGISISILALLSSFVYTAMTLILIEVEDLNALLWQGTLLILFFSFTIFLFLTYMDLMRIWGTIRSRYPRRPWISRWPSPWVLNLLETVALLLWWTSITFMLLAKNLIYLASTSLIITIVLLPIGYLLIFKPLHPKETTK